MMQQEVSDPFAAYRIKQNQPQPIEEPSQSSEDPFSAYRIKKSEDLPETYEIGRHATRIGSRMAEIVGGIPGDVENLVKSGLMFGLEKILPKETFEKYKKGSEIIEKTKLGKNFPTSGELQEVSEKLTGGFTKPQSEAEEIADEAAKTVASLLGPMKFRKALGIGVGSQLAKEGLKISGFGEGAQEAGKLGTMFLMSLYNPMGAMKYASSQFNIANNLSKGFSIKAVPLQTSMKKLIQELEQGIPTSSKNAVIRPAQDLLGKISDGKIKVQDLTAAKRDLNSLMVDPALLKREKILLKSIAKDVDMAIKPFEKLNPEFAKAYRPANEIYGAVMQGNKTSNFIRKTLGTKLLGGILAEAALGHPEAVLPTIGISAAGFGTIKAGEFFTRMIKSPELQKFYTKAIAAAAAEDASALRLYNDKIEEFLKKD